MASDRRVRHTQRRGGKTDIRRARRFSRSHSKTSLTKEKKRRRRERDFNYRCAAAVGCVVIGGKVSVRKGFQYEISDFLPAPTSHHHHLRGCVSVYTHYCKEDLPFLLYRRLDLSQFPHARISSHSVSWLAPVYLLLPTQYKRAYAIV